MPNIGNASVYVNNPKLRASEQCLRMENIWTQGNECSNLPTSSYVLRVKDKTLDDKLKFIEHYKMYIQCESNNLIQYN